MMQFSFVVGIWKEILVTGTRRHCRRIPVRPKPALLDRAFHLPIGGAKLDNFAVHEVSNFCKQEEVVNFKTVGVLPLRFLVLILTLKSDRVERIARLAEVLPDGGLDGKQHDLVNGLDRPRCFLAVVVMWLGVNACHVFSFSLGWWVQQLLHPWPRRERG